MRPRTLAAVLLAIHVCMPSWAGEYMSWRSQTTLPAEQFPTRWDGGKNVAWVTPLPGRAGSTPVVFLNRVFLTSVDDASGRGVALVLDRRSGRILKRIPVSAPRKLERGNTSASPSPCTDGKRTYFSFGTGELFATDMNGNVRWQRNLAKEFGPYYNDFGYSSSPVYHDRRLYVQVIQNDRPTKGLQPDGKPHESFVMAIEARTGRTISRVARPTSARKESKEAYTTPTVVEVLPGIYQLYVLGGDALTCHDYTTCAESHRWEGYNPKRKEYERVITSPVVTSEYAYVVSPRGRDLFAIETGFSGLGKVAWTYQGKLPDVCTPVVHGDRLYVLDGKRKCMTCLDAGTGARVYEQRLGGKAVHYASPTVAGGNIYMIDTAGEVIVMRMGDTYKELARFDIGEGPCHSTIAASRGQLFIRTAKNLYCVGRPPSRR